MTLHKMQDDEGARAELVHGKAEQQCCNEAERSLPCQTINYT